MKLIVKPFAEITIKSRPVRRQFIRQMSKNMRTLLKELAPDITLKGEWDNVEITTAVEEPAAVAEMFERLRNMPGIQHFYRVEDYPLGDFESIVEHCYDYYADILPGKYFAVRCKRVGKHDYTSMDVEKYVGSQLRQKCAAAGIQLGKPEVEVRIEVRFDRLLIEHPRQQGIGGYPLGALEQNLVLMSGGFDSTVAAYRMMRRGILTHFCFFNLGGRAHELGVMEVSHYLWKKFSGSHRVLFISVPFEEVVAEILDKVDDSQMGVILKRMMLRAASQVADSLDLEVLVTGEAISQVSSQTLKNLAVIDRATDKLVLRPLIASHKQDIINTAREIGTEEFAKNMPEYCGVISVNPTTRAKLPRVEKQESFFDMEILDRAIERATRTTIDQVLEQLGEAVEVEVLSQALAGQVIIDIRHPDEAEDQPLSVAGVEVVQLPFYAINNRFKTLDTNRQYLLYCDKGVMSRLHAHHLLHEGYDNVRVYRPVTGQQ